MTDADVREALREVIDPELGVNIVDLGLVYRIDVDGDRVTVAMTMTSPACPLADYLADLIADTVRQRVPGVRTVETQFEWQPPWTPEMMSLAARRQLGWNADPDER